MTKRLLIIADLPGWCFHNHAKELQSRLADDFDIDIMFSRGNHRFNHEDYDLIYLMCISSACGGAPPEKTVLGCRAEFIYRGNGTTWLIEKAKRMSKSLHVVNLRMFNELSTVDPDFPVKYITHGVNLQKFNGELDDLNGDLVVGWNGHHGSGGDKGWSEFIQPLESLEGVRLEYRSQRYCGSKPTHTPHDEMVNFYRDIHVYICASGSEGNNNSLLEAAACGRALVSTPVGTAKEYIEDGVNGLLVKRDGNAIREAIIKLRDDRELVKSFGGRIKKVIQEDWSWEKKAEEYRQWFLENVSS